MAETKLETRDLLDDAGNVIGTVALPVGTTEDRWVSALSGMQATREPSDEEKKQQQIDAVDAAHKYEVRAAIDYATLVKIVLGKADGKEIADATDALDAAIAKRDASLIDVASAAVSANVKASDDQAAVGITDVKASGVIAVEE